MDLVYYSCLHVDLYSFCHKLSRTISLVLTVLSSYSVLHLADFHYLMIVMNFYVFFGHKDTKAFCLKFFLDCLILHFLWHLVKKLNSLIWLISSYNKFIEPFWLCRWSLSFQSFTCICILFPNLRVSIFQYSAWNSLHKNATDCTGRFMVMV